MSDLVESDTVGHEEAGGETDRKDDKPNLSFSEAAKRAEQAGVVDRSADSENYRPDQQGAANAHGASQHGRPSVKPY